MQCLLFCFAPVLCLVPECNWCLKKKKNLIECIDLRGKPMIG